ncbi:MAG: Ig-like domain-containing protein [Planctomycetes bacterium]|nr:Ig-like domain-containing protein [Planctomycetota bacterium]
MKRILISIVLLSALLAVGCSGKINSRSPDNTKPFVKATMPANGAVDVPTNQRITIFFNEKVNTKTAEAAIELRAGSTSITNFTFQWTINKDTVTLLMPGAGNLTQNTNYTLTINAGYEDERENRATEPYSAYFSTGSTTTPSYFSVEKVVPVSNTSNVQTCAPLIFRIFFTDEVNPASVTLSNFALEETLSQDVVNCDIILSLNMREVTLITKDDLIANIQYTLTVASAISDNRAPATSLSSDFTAYYTPKYYKFHDKNSAKFLLFKDKNSVSSNSFNSAAMGKLTQGETSSQNYAQKTK